MGSWGLTSEGGRHGRDSLGSAGTLSLSTVFSTHATANTKSGWNQLTGSLAADCEGFWLWILARGTLGTDYDALVDLAVGAASSEQVILSNFPTFCAEEPHRPGGVYIPFPVAAGQAVSVRGQSSTGGQSIDVAVMFSASGFGYPGAPCGRVDTYGDATSDSGGTEIDPGGTANTKGSWVQMTSSLANPCRFLIVALGNQANTARQSTHISVDVGVGGAGSEKVVVPDLSMRASVDGASDCGAINHQYFGPMAVEIPAGTRVAVRAQCDLTDATDRKFDVILFAIS